MTNKFELHMNDAMELVLTSEVKGNFESEAQRRRVYEILAALTGYLTEAGTTCDQDDLLREIKVLPPKGPSFEAHNELSRECLMTVDDYRSAVESGAITNDDGTGYWATIGDVSDQAVDPSNHPSREVPIWATHVVWYNK